MTVCKRSIRLSVTEYVLPASHYVLLLFT